MQIKRRNIWLVIGLVLVCFFWQGTLVVRAGLEENPYVSLSPDGTAYTVQAGVKDTEWYELGTKVQTGVKSTLPTLQKGEHYYDYEMEGMIPIETWIVTQKYGRCIHKRYPKENTYHGVSFGRVMCYKSYFSGWFPVCANCNEVVEWSLFYMSDKAAATMQYIDVSKAYYHKCPHCNNLEQGVEHTPHICKNISKNRYFVRYDANGGNGYMAKSIHMYDNATMYEGREVTPQTSLSLNTYYHMGYTFDGWNTKADGSGKAYAEGATIQNLAQEEGAEVVLYAQWKVCKSVLEVDPAGGSYQGTKDVVKKSGLYGEVLAISCEQLSPPVGYTITFDTMGGEKIGSMHSSRKLKAWKQEGVFYGELQGNDYIFPARNNVVDRMTAVYEECSITLPLAKREGYSFGGWYLDKECTKRIGTAGDEFTPGTNVILYAGWVELQLNSKDNYVTNGGKGAVDLTWKQKDNTNKLYTIYQRKEEEEWKQILSAQKNNLDYEAEAEIHFSGEEETYTVPYTGVYQLKLCGAQGGDYGAFSGGYGGSVEAEVFLEKGDRLHCVIGGQNGYGGGGSATQYAVGGGASTVYSEKYGMLLIAGGGGGAGGYSAGLPGGTEESVGTDAIGMSGVSGGGGGFLGGKAGEVLIHYHDSNCMHTHTGSPTQMGGCYILPVPCNGTEFNAYETKRVFYYGNIEEIGGEWVHVFCVRCGSHECGGHLNITYKYSCKKCGKEYDTKVEKCTEICAYTTECEEAVWCGYENGEIISVKAAYGGSNYINKEYCMNYRENAGIQKGNGMLQITATIIGVLEENEANGIVATDLAAPEVVSRESVIITGLSEQEIRVAFQKPKDKGTTYFHMVKSHDVKTNTFLCTSNVTQNTLVSGVAGYYYTVDSNAETLVSKSHDFCADTMEQPFFIVKSNTAVQYLHVAPVDKAGNLGPTTHIKIATDEIKNWPVLTEKIGMKEADNVKVAAPDVYYVKADGTTPFAVECEGLVYGSASSKYQVTHISVKSELVAGEEGGIFTVITPMQSFLGEGSATYPMNMLQKKTEGNGPLADGGYTVTKRYNYGKNLLWQQHFILSKEADGQRIRMTPQAAVLTTKGLVYSEVEQDMENSIYVIADGQGPKIWGMEQLEGTEYLDFSKGEKRQVHLTAHDDGSGLAEFYVEIYNLDNGTTVRLEDTHLTGEITFEIAEDNLVFNGEFRLMVFAQDAVGNETVDGVRLQGVGLQAYVERILEPTDAPFKRGESGVLYVKTTGYVERVEITFPTELVPEGETNRFVYIYETPDYLQTEDLQFMVPLTAQDGMQTIQVKAFKNGTELENQPQFITIEVKGSVLDELRTRLR